MKREAFNHPKMLDLASRLDIPQAHAVGLVSMLHNWTPDVALAGDIGKWPNGAIARAVDWRGDPATFVQALIDSGWVDECSVNRLVIHDWEDHCENWVRAKAASLGVSFVTAIPALKHGDDAGNEPPTDPHAEPPTDPPSPPRDQTKPNQTKPNQQECGKFATSPWFDQFWVAYPTRKGRKRGRAAAAKLFAKLPEPAQLEVIEAAGNYARETGEGPNDIPPRDAERFLKNEFWKDYLGDRGPDAGDGRRRRLI